MDEVRAKQLAIEFIGYMDSDPDVGELMFIVAERLGHYEYSNEGHEYYQVLRDICVKAVEES